MQGEMVERKQMCEVNTYVAIDVETTGLNPKKDKIIEIGAVKIIDGRETEHFVTFVNPSRKLEEKTVQITGIEQKDIENAKSMQEIAPELIYFLEDLPFVGHKILFDYSFLKRSIMNTNLSTGVKFEKNGIDTLKLARKLLPTLPHKTLAYLCRHYGISHQAHRALEDARATGLLFEKLKEAFVHDDDFCAKNLVYQVKKEGAITKHQIELLRAIFEKHKLVPEVVIETLTKNEASRLYDNILAAYGR